MSYLVGLALLDLDIHIVEMYREFSSLLINFGIGLAVDVGLVPSLTCLFVVCLFLCLSSYKGRTVDALGQKADEGRGKRRYASGSCNQALIRRFPNGVTRYKSPCITLS
jgi:hypothetical protein